MAGRRGRDPRAGRGGRRPARAADDGGAPRRRRRRRRARPRRAPPPRRHAPPRRASTTACPPPTCPTSSPPCSTRPIGDQHDWPTVVGDAPPEVLVCGHGRRDPCCGRWGTLLHVELAARVRPRRGCGAAATPAATGSRRRPSRCPTAAPGPTSTPTSSTASSTAPPTSPASSRTTAAASRSTRGRRSSSGRCSSEHGWAWLDGEVTEVRTEVAPDGQSARGRPSRWRAADGTVGRADGRGGGHAHAARAGVRRAAGGGQEVEPGAAPCGGSTSPVRGASSGLAAG